jgi:hypothetical protein
VRPVLGRLDAAFPEVLQIRQPLSKRKGEGPKAPCPLLHCDRRVKRKSVRASRRSNGAIISLVLALAAGEGGALRNVNVISSLSTDFFGNSPFRESVLGCHFCGEQHPMSEDDKHDDENTELGSPRHHRVEPSEIGLFVTDKEMYRRLGVGPKTGRIAARALEPHGFPIKQPLFGNRRYWPAVRLFLDRYYRLVEGPRVDRQAFSTRLAICEMEADAVAARVRSREPPMPAHSRIARARASCCTGR